MLRERWQRWPWWVQFLMFTACSAGAVVSGGVFALVPLTFGMLWLTGWSADSLGLRISQRRLLDFAGGAALGTAMVLAVILPFELMTEVHWQRNQQVTTGLWMGGLWFYLKSSIFEELVFRGYGFLRLIEAIGFGWAQAVIALLFAVYHTVNVGMPLVPALLFTGLGSLLFGYAFRRSCGVMLPIGVHGAWNFWQEQLTGSSGRGQPGIWHMVLPAAGRLSFGFTYGALLLVTAGAAVAIRYWWRRKCAMEPI